MPKFNEFSWKEMVSNSQGKTSGMLFVCLVAGFNSAMCFSTAGLVSLMATIYSMVFHKPMEELLPPDITFLLRDTMMQSIAMFALATTGLVSRRFSKDKPLNEGKPEVE